MTESKKKAPVAESDPFAIASTMAAVNPVATEAWMGIMAESAHFMTKRLRQDLETQKALLECRSPQDLVKVQSDFIQTAIEQYSDEIQRMIEMMSKASEDIAEDATSGHSRNKDDVPI